MTPTEAPPPIEWSERDVIAHLFEVAFEALAFGGLLPDNVHINLVRHETKRLREGHVNAEE